jgi:hypothetical protein
MSAHGGPDLITSGLVMQLDAANTDSYPLPRTGSTWFDISTQGNNGTLYNSPTFSSENNGCIVLTNANANVNCNGFTFNNPNLTFNCWAKVNTIGAGYSHFISKELALKYRTNNSTGVIEALYSSSGVGWTGSIASTTPILVNTWYNLTATAQSNSFVRLYINGTLVASTAFAATLATNSNEINIGSYYPFGPDTFNGSIAIAQVYNRALSPPEILQNYNATKSRFFL